MYLVFDVGGTFIKYALMDQKGKIYEKYKVPTPFQDGKVDDNGGENRRWYCRISRAD